MQIRCPHCHVPFDSIDHTSWAYMLCPACGSSFSLTGVDATCAYRPGVQVLGHFELLQEVGAGRFGSVWKARDTQLQRIVAIKIPRQRNLDPKETDAFLRDARAAAQLNHPRIAGVHEVGREDNTVFIVTDFIDGANLGEWLTGQQLTSRESAELIVKIAEALHHAHEAGVVHRDLKPSNIMLDQEGEPHVIDFGLARRETGEIAMTVEGQVLGTPAYMSPEQARGEGYKADRRSDVYSLGVILFELFTGELPFRGDARMLIVQILNEEPPSPRKLKGNISRDLETITVKCLQKDPAKRYQTAQKLADDLERFLAGKPIQARPLGRGARAWRWCRRNPMVATLSGALLAVLLGLSIGAPIVAVRQASLRQQAEMQQKRAEGVNAFFTDAVFGQANPNRGGRAGIGLVEALDIAVDQIDERFPDDADTRAVDFDRFGEVYNGIDEPKKAIEQFKKAISLRRSLAGALDPGTLKSRSNLGLALYLADQYSESKESLQSTVADQSKLLGEGHPDTLQTAIFLCIVLRQMHDKDSVPFAEQTYRRALVALGPRHPLTLEAQDMYAWALRHDGQPQKALEQVEPAAIGLREILGAENVRSMLAAYNYGACLQELDRNKEAIDILEPLLAVRYRLLGPTHVETLHTAGRLAQCLLSAGDRSAALAVLEQIHSNLKSIETAANIQRANPLGIISDLYVGLQRYDRSLEIQDIIYRMYATALRKGDFRRIDFEHLKRFVNDLAASPHSQLRNIDRAFELATEACESTANNDSNANAAMGSVLAQRGDYAGASIRFEKAVDLEPNDAQSGYSRALVRLRSGDPAGYRGACEAMSRQFAMTTHDFQRDRFTCACCLGPAAVEDLGIPLKIAQDLVSKALEDPQYLFMQGALLYRTEEFEEAIKPLIESIAAAGKAGAGKAPVIYPQFFLAMAKWKMGDKAEARRLLAEAHSSMDEEMKTSPPWNSRATLELFRSEADALISESNGDTAASSP